MIDACHSPTTRIASNAIGHEDEAKALAHRISIQEDCRLGINFNKNKSNA